MKPLYRLNVIPSLPEQLTPLWELGHNLWWTWSKETIRTLYQIDPEAWIESQRNPLRFWAFLRPEQLDALIADEQLRGRIERVVEQFEGFLPGSGFDWNHTPLLCQNMEDLPVGGVVVDDGDADARERRGRRGCRLEHLALLPERDVHGEGRPLAQLALDADVAAVVVDDTEGD